MQLGKVVISFGFDHFNDALNGFFAEGTSCAGCQLLIAILAHSIMPARFEDDGSNIDIAKGTIAILSFILTPFLFLFVLFTAFTDQQPEDRQELYQSLAGQYQ